MSTLANQILPEDIPTGGPISIHTPEPRVAEAAATAVSPGFLSQRPRADILAALSEAISKGDPVAAAGLIQEAESGFGEDSAFDLPVARCKMVVRRSEWLDIALEAMHRDLEEDRFASAMGHFREALGLSRSLPALKSRVDQIATRHCKDLLPANWRIAESILREVAQVEPAFPTPPELELQIKVAREDESINSALHQAERLALEGRTTEARQKLAALAALHPKDERIVVQTHALDHPDASAAPHLKSVPVPVLAAAKLPDIQAQTAAAYRPGDSELDTEGTLTDPTPGLLTPWRARVLISNSAWNAIKNFCALAATTAMLGMAGVLVWRHFARPQIKPLIVAQVSQPRIKTNSTPAPGNSVFEDVPAPSEQESILRSVQSYADQSGKKLSDEIVDEIAMKGNQASVRYRPKEPDVGGVVTFILIRQSGIWKVQAVN